jgi:hypothetical protein
METVNISPLEYTANIKEQFSELIFHLRDDVSKVEDRKGRNLFKVSAKVLARLQKAFINYEERIKKLSTNKKPIQLIY